MNSAPNRFTWLLLLSIVGIGGLPRASADDGHRWIDLGRASRSAEKLNSPITELRIVTSGGTDRQAIFQHASKPGGPLAEIRFHSITLPSLDNGVKKILLRTSIGFKDGDGFDKSKGIDGATFLIAANGREVFRKKYDRQRWSDVEIDLSSLSGKDVELRFSVDPGKTAAADWCSWAEPALWLIGDAASIAALTDSNVELPKHWPLVELRKHAAAPQRVVRQSEGVWIGTLDEHLDLAVAVEREAPIAGPATVPLAPRMVVGEGQHKHNHTLVKVLNPYGLADVQFLAFPPEVRGGVWVEVLRRGSNLDPLIVTCPIDNTRFPEVRLFDLNGQFVRRIELPKLQAPFVITSGNFFGDDGDELAVSSAIVSTPVDAATPGKESVNPRDVLILDSQGDRLGAFTLISKTGESRRLSALRQGDLDQLMMYLPTTRSLSIADFRERKHEQQELTDVPEDGAIFPSVFDEQPLLVVGKQTKTSRLIVIRPDGSQKDLDVGREENAFCIALQPGFEQEFGPLKGKQKAKHIQIGVYRHLRMEPPSPGYSDPLSAEFGGKGLANIFRSRHLSKPLTEQPIAMWNPCFTHRQIAPKFSVWAEAVDSQTGLPKYMMQNAESGVDGFKSGEPSTGLISSTYAVSEHSLQRLYTDTLRTFLRLWAPQYRAHPDRVPSIEPNHEHEIVVASGQGVGDYNPAMVAGFYDWLTRMYGDDLAHWKQRFSIPFDEFFDAPRGLERGAWDQYSPANPFFTAWVEYNRYVVNRTLALTYREALLAGIPPEMIHCHQIPDTYAIAPILGGLTRITPIDYAMTAGVGYGFTKFGVNHLKPTNAIESAKTSGFDSFVMGEFQPLTTDADLADAELRYVFENGARAIHALHWGATHTGGKTSPDDRKKNRVVYDAVQRLLNEDPPRIGQTGGVGQVRSLHDDSRTFNIVSIGAGEQHRGLIKSVKEDGRMEGTVYCIPFHSHVDVIPLKVSKQAEHYHVRVSAPKTTGKTGELVTIVPGSQIEISFTATAKPGRTSGEHAVEIRLFNQQSELIDLRATLVIGPQPRACRYVLRIPTRVSGLVFQVQSPNVDLDDLIATLQTPDVADVQVGKHTGTPHVGGVTFDVVDDGQ